jgi:hydroxypyruvate reductase
VSAREAALAIWANALAAGDVAPLVRAHLRLDGSRVTAGPVAVDLDRTRRVIVLGCGKASGAMAVALESLLGDRITEGLVVVKDGYLAPTRRVRLLEAGHPVPDARGRAAALLLLERAREAGPDDLVVCLISGGGSALTPAPAPPITLEEKQVVTRLLLAAGATIGELNAVRKHLSLVKGGQLARAVAPARLLVLALSDVIGDPLDVIASGMTAPDPTTFADAIRAITQRGVADRMPSSVRARLEAGRRGEIEETPKPGDPIFGRVTNLVIGNNALIVEAAAVAATAQGYRAHVLTRDLQGEARHVGRDLVTRGRRLAPPAALIAGGETTVTVVGDGRGGRCQELALAAALTMRATDEVTVLAAGTDGTDGPTDAAGAIVDGGTVARARAAGLDAERALARNDSYPLLAASGDLVRSGPTNTNLLDLYVVLHGNPSGDLPGGKEPPVLIE